MGSNPILSATFSIDLSTQIDIIIKQTLELKKRIVWLFGEIPKRPKGLPC